jgi:hypothetical protein
MVDGTADYDINHGEIFSGVFPGEKEIFTKKKVCPVEIKMVYPSEEFFK